jgi:pimeloyl-ACP methyl ester carboxylesterase
MRRAPPGAFVLVSGIVLLLLGAAVWLVLFHPFGAPAVRREPSPPRPDESRPEGQRTTVFFPARDGTRLEGWLFTPVGTGSAPLVLMAPGLTGTKEGPLERFAWRFVREGLAVLAFDFRSFGGSDGTPRHHVDPFRQTEDYEAALAFVREELRDPRIDASRIALWGSSFSGGVAIAVAARSTDIAALVAQVPFVETADSQRPRALHMALYVAGAVLDQVRAQLGAALGLNLPPVYLPAFGQPGEFAFATSQENPSRHRPSERGAAFWSELPERMRGGWGNALLARFLADFDRFRPMDSLAGLRCPVLLVAASRDELVPAALVERAFAGIAHAEKSLIVHPCGHFAIYTDPWFEENARNQARFLKQALATRTGTRASG